VGGGGGGLTTKRSKLGRTSFGVRGGFVAFSFTTLVVVVVVVVVVGRSAECALRSRTWGKVLVVRLL